MIYVQSNAGSVSGRNIATTPTTPLPNSTTEARSERGSPVQLKQVCERRGRRAKELEKSSELQRKSWCREGSLFFGDPVLPVLLEKLSLINNFRIGQRPVLA